MLSWTRLMNDLSTLTANSKIKLNKPKPWNFREKENDKSKGRKRYQERVIQDKDAKEQIKDFEKQDKLGDSRV